MRISTSASLIDFTSVSTCKHDNSRRINTIDGGVGTLASTRYAHTLAVDSAQTFRMVLSEVRRGLGCAGNKSPKVSSLTTSYELGEETLGRLASLATFIGHFSNYLLLLRNLTSYRQLIIYDATHRDLPTLTLHSDQTSPRRGIRPGVTTSHNSC